ncbi:phage major tail tube protein [Janthinobacterium lividum]|uniref:Phage major tail tube protein n=1 Tax=Janthinobacterium lividum TaxID=29581 RepID=A0A5C4NRQ8_9BURK|nr:phage major tail tube protein [Janthinobacterium lividum]NHQ90276.1 phage major tail tube protein [Janthinobacterium lividum]TNC77544.1 phage major tail tube protein [Janthinobacterium lividum]
MGLPRKLKDFILFQDGTSYMGQVPEVTLPKLSRKMEEYRAGGMSGPVSVDFGNEAIQLEWSAGGLIASALQHYGASSHGAVQLRFAGAYQEDDDGTVAAVEVVVRGRYKEVDMGTAKMGDDTTHKYTMPCSYYKLMIDGATIIELDFMSGTEIMGGVSRNDAVRRAIGL